MYNIKILTALLNGGLPDIHDKILSREELTKEDYKKVKNQIKDFDDYFVEGWKDSETREILKNFVNDFAECCRCSSLWVS
jgi:uncharacterized protein YpuA (DUF1002 family)